MARHVVRVIARPDVAVAACGPYTDQSHSLNLYPNIGQLGSIYMYAWKAGINTIYYLRSRPATKMAKDTVSATPEQAQANDAVVCSLENPEYCQACQ